MSLPGLLAPRVRALFDPQKFDVADSYAVETCWNYEDHEKFMTMMLTMVTNYDDLYIYDILWLDMIIYDCIWLMLWLFMYFLTVYQFSYTSLMAVSL